MSRDQPHFRVGALAVRDRRNDGGCGRAEGVPLRGAEALATLAPSPPSRGVLSAEATVR